MAPINPRSGRFFGHTESLGNVAVKRRSTGTTATVQTKRRATPGSSTIMTNLNGPHEAEASRAWMHVRLVATADWLGKATRSCYLMATQATLPQEARADITETVNVYVAGDVVEIC